MFFGLEWRDSGKGDAQRPQHPGRDGEDAPPAGAMFRTPAGIYEHPDPYSFLLDMPPRLEVDGIKFTNHSLAPARIRAAHKMMESLIGVDGAPCQLDFSLL